MKLAYSIIAVSVLGLVFVIGAMAQLLLDRETVKNHGGFADEAAVGVPPTCSSVAVDTGALKISDMVPRPPTNYPGKPFSVSYSTVYGLDVPGVWCQAANDEEVTICNHVISRMRLMQQRIKDSWFDTEPSDTPTQPIPVNVAYRVQIPR